jgi:hypothetical protein
MGDLVAGIRAGQARLPRPQDPRRRPRRRRRQGRPPSHPQRHPPGRVPRHPSHRPHDQLRQPRVLPRRRRPGRRRVGLLRHGFTLLPVELNQIDDARRPSLAALCPLASQARRQLRGRHLAQPLPLADAEARRHRSRRCAVRVRIAGHAAPAPIHLPLSALEIPILPLLLPRPAVRYSLLGLGAWALLWTLGLLASLRTNPHVLSAVALRLRSGFQLDASIPLGSRSPPSDTAAQAHSGSSRSRTTEPAHRSPSKARATSRSSSENQSLSASSTAGRQTSTPSTSTQTAQPHL